MRKKALSSFLGILLVLVMIWSPVSVISAMSESNDVPYAVVKAGSESEDFSVGDANMSSQKLTKWRIAPVGETSTGIAPVGDATSALSADTSKWLGANVPGTVLGNLLDAKIYDDRFVPNNDGEKDVYFSSNISKIPLEDFDTPWWYATTFTLPEITSERVNINFRGIAYTGEIYVNGHKLSNKNLNVTENDIKNDTGIAGSFTNPVPTGIYVNPTTQQIPTESTLRPYPNSVSFDTYKDLFIGTFRHYDVDITDYVNKDGLPNDIRIKINRPQYKHTYDDDTTAGDLSYYYVDWHPQPNDSNMGLTGDVVVNVSGAVRLSNPAAASKVAVDLASANLTFYVDATNMTDTEVTGILSGVICGPNGEKVADVASGSVTIPAGAYNKEIAIKYTMNNPQLWWPNQYGDQPLYTIDYAFNVGTDVSDTLHHRFGVRELTTMLNTSKEGTGASVGPMMQVYVNHVPILLKGGGYCPTDLFLRQSDRADRAVIDYVKNMGMNMIRDEGKFWNDNILDVMDENGILQITGWCCCDRHQATGNWMMSERFVGYEGLYAQLRNLREHASTGIWLNGSDTSAANMVEYSYLQIEAKLRWPDIGIISRTAATGSTNAAAHLKVKSGMHMEGGYDNQTPNLFYAIKAANFGFVSEGGGGAAMPVTETIKKVLPKANYWPYNVGANLGVWNYQACRINFTTFNQIMGLVDNTYGPSDSLELHNARAQLFNYDSQRAQYEAQTYYRFVSTAGIVNWMLNSPRPSFYWNQFDYYLNPHGGTYGVAKANEPVHIFYNTYDKSAHVVNNTLENYEDLTATLSIYDLNGNLINTELTKTIDLAAAGAPAPVNNTGAASNTNTNPTIVDAKVGYVLDETGTTMNDLTYKYYGVVTESYGLDRLWSYNEIMNSLTRPTTDVYFIRLELADSTGKVISYNSYAESMRSDIAGSSTNWARCAQYQMADLTQLNSLPAVALDVKQIGRTSADGKIVQSISIQNPTGNVAYGVELKAYTGAEKKDLVNPVVYSDNLIAIFPGETRIITVTHNVADLDVDAVIGVTCYNNLVNPAARAANSIYKGVYWADVTSNTATTNNLSRGKAAVASSGFGTATNANAISANANTAALNGKTFIESDLNTVFTSTANAAGNLVLDLGSVQSIDRLIFRWVQSTSSASDTNANSGMLIANRPNYVKVEVSDNNTVWNTLVEAYDNTNCGSSMTDIVLDETATGRYIRVTPSGNRALSPEYGVLYGQYPVFSSSNRNGGGVRQVNASTQFSVSSMEVYAFRNTAYIEILGDGTVTVGNKVYKPTNADGSKTNANQRVALIPGDGNITLTFNRSTVETPLFVSVDGVDVTDKLVSDVLTLSGMKADAVVVAKFGEILAELRQEKDEVPIYSGVDYTVSLTGAQNVNLVTLTLELDGDYLDIYKFTPLNGFAFLGEVSWANSANNVWTATMKLMKPSGFATSPSQLDILNVTGRTKGVIGDTPVALTDISIVGGDADNNAAYLSYLINNGEVITSVVFREKTYSKYDLNRDGKIDDLDLSIAIRFYLAEVTDNDWEDIAYNGRCAKDADVTGDGIVDLADLIEIMANYCDSYDLYPR